MGLLLYKLLTNVTPFETSRVMAAEQIILGGDHGARLAEELPDPPPTWLVMLYPRRVDESVQEQLRQRGYGRIARFHCWIDWGGGDVEVWQC